MDAKVWCIAFVHLHVQGCNSFLSILATWCNARIHTNATHVTVGRTSFRSTNANGTRLESYENASPPIGGNCMSAGRSPPRSPPCMSAVGCLRLTLVVAGVVSSDDVASTGDRSPTLLVSSRRAADDPLAACALSVNDVETTVGCAGADGADTRVD